MYEVNLMHQRKKSFSNIPEKYYFHTYMIDVALYQHISFFYQIAYVGHISDIVHVGLILSFRHHDWHATSIYILTFN